MMGAGRVTNPVLARELTQRMRGPRAMIMLTIYLVILSIIVVLVYRSSSGGGGFNAAPITQIANAGESLFEWTLLFTMLLVLFLVPGFTAGSIAGERERQTLLPMQVTLLRPRNIVLGKIGASVLFTMLLIVATLPLVAVSYLIGGVRLREVLTGLAVVMFTALALAAISVACSTLMRRVQTATVLAYGLVLLLTGATIAVFMVARQIDQSRGSDTVDPPELIVALNPLLALADVVGDHPDPFGDQFSGGYSGEVAPLSGLNDLIVPDVFNDFDGGAEAIALEFDQFGRPVEPPGGFPGQGGFPLWGKYTIFMGAFAALSVLVSSRRLRTPAKTER